MKLASCYGSVPFANVQFEGVRLYFCLHKINIRDLYLQDHIAGIFKYPNVRIILPKLKFL